MQSRGSALRSADRSSFDASARMDVYAPPRALPHPHPHPRPRQWLPRAPQRCAAHSPFRQQSPRPRWPRRPRSASLAAARAAPWGSPADSLHCPPHPLATRFRRCRRVHCPTAAPTAAPAAPSISASGPRHQNVPVHQHRLAGRNRTSSTSFHVCARLHSLIFDRS